MAGGTWATQTKTLPGVYTNYTAKSADSANGASGIVTMALAFPWFAAHSITVITSAQVKTISNDFGADALPIIEALKNASQVLLYRLDNNGTAAAVTIGNLICIAKYKGKYGNEITVAVESVVAESKFYVITYISGNEVDSQKVSDISGLTANDWVTFSASGENKTLTASAGAPLTGGDNGTVTAADHTAFLTALELEGFSALACISNDADIKPLYAAFTKRMIEDEGKYFQTVIPDYSADFEGIISIQNGVKLSNGTVVDKVNASAFVAGACSSSDPTASLTNFQYVGAVDVDTRYTVTQQEAYSKSGQMIFIPGSDGKVYIQKDINTLVTFSETRSYAFSKNKVIRTLFAVSNKINEISRQSFIGKLQNTPDSRELLKSTIYSYFRELKGSGVLSEITTDDITVKTGEKLDSIVVDYIIRPVDTIDIIYNTIVVES